MMISHNLGKKLTKKENLLNSGLSCPGGPLSENQRKRKESQVLRHCQRTKKKLWNMKVTAIGEI